jgi:hypothetical protein
MTAYRPRKALRMLSSGRLGLPDHLRQPYGGPPPASAKGCRPFARFDRRHPVRVSGVSRTVTWLGAIEVWHPVLDRPFDLIRRETVAIRAFQQSRKLFVGRKPERDDLCVGQPSG